MSSQDISEKKDLGYATSTDLIDGPIEERSCTDSLCCFIYVAFSIVCIMIFCYSLNAGDPRRLAQGYDPDHRACGIDKDVKDYPLIYFTSFEKSTLYKTVCVKSCPSPPNGIQDETF